MRFQDRNDLAPRTRRGHPHQNTTGVASANCSQPLMLGEIQRLMGRPIIGPIDRINSGTERATPIQNRRFISLYWASSPEDVGSTNLGSRSIPQIGSLPGRSVRSPGALDRCRRLRDRRSCWVGTCHASRHHSKSVWFRSSPTIWNQRFLSFEIPEHHRGQLQTSFGSQHSRSRKFGRRDDWRETWQDPPTCRRRGRWLGFRWGSLRWLGKEVSLQLTQFSFRLFCGQLGDGLGRPSYGRCMATVLEDHHTSDAWRRSWKTIVRVVCGDGLG